MSFEFGLFYNVYYKTNKSDAYILFKENLSTQENYDLDFTEIQLNNDDYITETYFEPFLVSLICSFRYSIPL